MAHLRRRYYYSGLVVPMPPRVVVVDSRIGRDDAFPTIMTGRAESSSFFGAPRRARKAGRALPEPSHPMVRAPRADRAVDAGSLRLARLEGARVAQREVRVATFRTIRPRRAGLHVVIFTDVVAPR